MATLLSCLLFGLLFTYGYSQTQYPIGDIRNCPTNQVQNANAPLLQMDALPGLGFDNLRNIDTGRVYATNFSECQISQDGQYILPNSIYLIPVLNSEVDFSAEVFDHFDNWKSATATSINVEAKYGSAFSKVSGKFSTDYQTTKSKMVNSKSSSVRVGLRHHLYSVHVDPSSQLHPSFKSRVLDIAANIQNNNTELAHYLTDLLIRDYGTHVVTSIEVGASLYQTTFVAKKYSQASESSQLNVSVSASASFFSSFSISTNFKFSKSHTDTEGFSSSTTHSHTSTHGGPPFKLGANFSYTDWENGILDHLVPIDRRGQPLHTAINSFNVPELPDVLLLETIEYIYKSISKYYSINTHYGCTEPDSPNFSFQVNVDDGSCQMTRQNHSFGGIYQTCDNAQSYDVCKELSVAQTNPLSGGYLCPEGYHSIPLHTDTVTVTTTQDDCTRHCGFLGFSCHDDCKKRTIINYATYRAYWCVYPPGQAAPSNSGYMFGGVYTSKEQNPVTGARSCPAFFYPLHFGQDLEVCVSNDQEGSAFSIPFGGFQSCQSGNPLASSPNQFNEGIYRHGCPCRYSQFMATVDQGCVINYCSEVEAYKKQLPHPPRLPPYKVKADLSVNISDTLAITGPYGNLWVRGNNGEWMEYKQGQYSNGVDYLKSFNTESINPITGQVESKSATKGELAGVIIGTVIATLLTVVFIILAVTGVKKYRARRKRRAQLAQRYSTIDDTFESTTDQGLRPTNEDPLVRELNLRIQQ